MTPIFLLYSLAKRLKSQLKIVDKELSIYMLTVFSYSSVFVELSFQWHGRLTGVALYLKTGTILLSQTIRLYPLNGKNMPLLWHQDLVLSTHGDASLIA